MNVLQLVLTLVLVAGGLFVYDTFVADRSPPAPTESLRVDTPAAPPPATTPVEPPMRVELQGAGVEALVRRVEALEARAEELAAAASRRATPGEGGAGIPPGFRVEDVVDVEEPIFDERELAWFRAMKDEVDRQQRQERFERMISNQLERTGVSLTDEQREGVLKATLDYRQSITARYRQEGFSKQPAEVRNEALSQLRADYEQSLYMLVPAAEADKILQQMGRFPGMSGRQFGPGRPR